jgi:hypothetical protein
MSQANVPSSADRLARFVPISVAQRTYKERIKVAAGKILTLEDLILEQLVKTFKTDLQIARDLHCSVHTVHKIRHAVDEVNGYQRARRFLVNLLRVDPKRSRIELAKMIAPISYKLLENVVKEMGLSGAAAGNSRRGKFHTKDRRNALAAANKIHQADSEYRKNLSEKSKALWQDPEYRKNMNKSRERRTREFKALWQKPEFHKSLTEQAKARWQDPEYRKKATAWLDNNPELRKSLSEKRKSSVARPRISQEGFSRTRTAQVSKEELGVINRSRRGSG